MNTHHICATILKVLNHFREFLIDVNHIEFKMFNSSDNNKAAVAN